MPTPTTDELVGFLGIGRDNSKTSGEIASHFSISDERQEVPIRNVIREAIENGELIGSGNRGYYLIANQNEFDEYIATLEGHREGILRRIQNLRSNWNRRV